MKAKARLGLAIVAFAGIFSVIAVRLVDVRDGKRRVMAAAAASRRMRWRLRAQTFSTATAKFSQPDVKTPSLFAEPRKIIDVDEAVELLTAVLPDLDANEVRERLSSKRGFVWLKREITPKPATGNSPARYSRHGLPDREQAYISQRTGGLT